MDINFSYSVTNISKEDIENMFACMTNIMTLVKDAQHDEYKDTHMQNEICDLKSKIAELERENNSFKIEKENAKVDANLLASKYPSLTADKPAKKKTTVEDFKEV